MSYLTKVRLKELNPHLVCVLCGGYLITATTVQECLHSFCKSCLLRYLETSHVCPICDVNVNKTGPHANIREDNTLQDVVYKMVPGLFQREITRRRAFYNNESSEDSMDSCCTEQLTINLQERGLVTCHKYPDALRHDDHVSVCLILADRPPTRRTKLKKGRLAKLKALDRRYLLCPASFPVGLLKKFIREKFQLSRSHEVDVYHKEEPLIESCTLSDVCYIYQWKKHSPLRIYYTVTKALCPKKGKTGLRSPRKWRQPGDILYRNKYESDSSTFPKRNLRKRTFDKQTIIKKQNNPSHSKLESKNLKKSQRRVYQDKSCHRFKKRVISAHHKSSDSGLRSHSKQKKLYSKTAIVRYTGKGEGELIVDLVLSKDDDIEEKDANTNHNIQESIVFVPCSEIDSLPTTYPTTISMEQCNTDTKNVTQNTSTECTAPSDCVVKMTDCASYDCSTVHKDCTKVSQSCDMLKTKNSNATEVKLDAVKDTHSGNNESKSDDRHDSLDLSQSIEAANESGNDFKNNENVKSDRTEDSFDNWALDSDNPMEICTDSEDCNSDKEDKNLNNSNVSLIVTGSCENEEKKGQADSEVIQSSANSVEIKENPLSKILLPHVDQMKTYEGNMSGLDKSDRNEKGIMENTRKNMKNVEVQTEPTRSNSDLDAHNKNERDNTELHIDNVYSNDMQNRQQNFAKKYRSPSKRQDKNFNRSGRDKNKSGSNTTNNDPYLFTADDNHNYVNGKAADPDNMEENEQPRNALAFLEEYVNFVHNANGKTEVEMPQSNSIKRHESLDKDKIKLGKQNRKCSTVKASGGRKRALSADVTTLACNKQPEVKISKSNKKLPPLKLKLPKSCSNSSSVSDNDTRKSDDKIEMMKPSNSSITEDKTLDGQPRIFLRISKAVIPNLSPSIDVNSSKNNQDNECIKPEHMEYQPPHIVSIQPILNPSVQNQIKSQKDEEASQPLYKDGTTSSEPLTHDKTTNHTNSNSFVTETITCVQPAKLRSKLERSAIFSDNDIKCDKTVISCYATTMPWKPKLMNSKVAVLTSQIDNTNLRNKESIKKEVNGASSRNKEIQEIKPVIKTTNVQSLCSIKPIQLNGPPKGDLKNSTCQQFSLQIKTEIPPKIADGKKPTMCSGITVQPFTYTRMNPCATNTPENKDSLISSNILSTSSMNIEAAHVTANPVSSFIPLMSLPSNKQNIMLSSSNSTYKNTTFSNENALKTIFQFPVISIPHTSTNHGLFIQNHVPTTQAPIQRPSNIQISGVTKPISVVLGKTLDVSRDIPITKSHNTTQNSGQSDTRQPVVSLQYRPSTQKHGIFSVGNKLNPNITRFTQNLPITAPNVAILNPSIKQREPSEKTVQSNTHIYKSDSVEKSPTVNFDVNPSKVSAPCSNVIVTSAGNFYTQFVATPHSSTAIPVTQSSQNYTSIPIVPPIIPINGLYVGERHLSYHGITYPANVLIMVNGTEFMQSSQNINSNNNTQDIKRKAVINPHVANQQLANDNQKEILVVPNKQDPSKAVNTSKILEVTKETEKPLAKLQPNGYDAPLELTTKRNV